jgi:hypothetical protein
VRDAQEVLTMADLIDRDALLLKQKAHADLFADSTVHDDIVRRDEATAALAEIINAPAVNRWIPVEDALPEDGQRVLICSKSKRLFDVVFRANAQMPSFDTKIFGKVYAWCCADVIKWMPLPESPENE